jgi:endogenous inhibitor of DNA gyrase (YacG/DUF329 family)
MTKCSVCGKRMVGGYKAGAERFCSLQCYTYSPSGTFCKACLDSTSLQSPGGTFTFNTIGTRLFFSRERCPSCHSIVQRKAFCALFVPLIPLGTYRVIYTGPSQYIGRRRVAHVANAPVPTAPR